MSVRIRAASRARRLAALSMGLAALVLVPTVASVGQTEAAWVDREHATTTVQVPTVTITKVASCPLSNPAVNLAGNQVATMSWTIPATATATVVPPSQLTYRLTPPTGAPTVYAPVQVTGTSPSSTTFTLNNGPVGTWTVTVTPTRNSWSTGSTASWDGAVVTYTIVVAQNLVGRYIVSCT